MYIRVTQIKLPIQHTEKEIYQQALRLAGISKKDVLSAHVEKQSIDARKKDRIQYVYNCLVEVRDGTHFKRGKQVEVALPVVYNPCKVSVPQVSKKISVVGAGPAGLFAAYLLALNGCRPVIYERGKAVRERTEDVERFFETGSLDPESNVQFGEGGAGTFSDGKLSTMVKDKEGRGRFVLETFVRLGAPKSILYEAKPHIGTDLLINVVENMRKAILDLGGEIHFSTCVTDLQIEQGRLKGLTIEQHGETMVVPMDAVILAPGHSARDTFAALHARGVPMSTKSFAVGFRIEHPQTMINEAQYGPVYADQLPPASYKLTYRAANGRSVYSFCMCPGGYVVNASSEKGNLAVNGMSRHARDGANANSAIIVSVTPEDYPGKDPADPLSGISFQRELEKKTYEIAAGRIPQQLYGDYKANRASEGYGTFDSCCMGAHAFANLRLLLPEELSSALIEAIGAFGQKIKGFDREDAILSGIESRTSSPVRIERNQDFESVISGLYPCGEGAGYAGGIMSAAMDGLKCAEAVMNTM